MANVNVFISPDPNGEAPFRVIDHTFCFPRLPIVGEVVCVGDDEDGVAADYEVVLVHHCPLQPCGIDAEIYTKRVYIVNVIGAKTPSPEQGTRPWNPQSWPKIGLKRATR